MLPKAVLAENTHPFENPSLRTDNPLGLLGVLAEKCHPLRDQTVSPKNPFG